MASELKEKSIDKIKQECVKRGIPSEFVELIISLLLNDLEQVKKDLPNLLEKCPE